MLKGKTKSGFEYEIEDDALDDWDLLEVLTNISRGDATYIIEASKMLLGEKQLSALKAHVKSIKGRVSVVAMEDEITEILTSNQDTKNS